MKKIVVVGSVNTDMVVTGERIPAPGETVLGGNFQTHPGGKGANQAVAAARMGGDVTLIAKVGDDPFGREARTRFQQEQIDTGFLLTDPEPASGVALIMVDARGENCIAVAPGANAALTPDDLEPARHRIEQADALLLQLEIPIPTLLAAARLAAAGGRKVILNPAPATELPAELYPLLSVITPNQTEAELLTGIRLDNEDALRRAAARLCDRGAATAVITLGSRGAYCFPAGNGQLIPAFRVEPVDTTAAGDVFNGALAVALAVTRPGAQESAPGRDECRTRFGV